MANLRRVLKMGERYHQDHRRNGGERPDVIFASGAFSVRRGAECQGCRCGKEGALQDSVGLSELVLHLRLGFEDVIRSSPLEAQHTLEDTCTRRLGAREEREAWHLR